jgi:hypothetical protein
MRSGVCTPCARGLRDRETVATRQNDVDDRCVVRLAQQEIQAGVAVGC